MGKIPKLFIYVMSYKKLFIFEGGNSNRMAMILMTGYVLHRRKRLTNLGLMPEILEMA